MSSPSPQSEVESREAVVAELVDGELVAVDARALEPRRTVKEVVVQAAAVATTGFVAGAIATAVVAHKASGARRRRLALDVVDTQRFVVDVHRVRPRTR